APVHLDLIAAYQLYSMGLVKKQGNQVMASCNLYRQYFRDHLGELL
ncbi:MAG: molecular chaperone Tir, partial [Moorea sp. SIO3B2]|nr:molecular chaperone Tir [Moorena sp. SIO3B2]